MKAEDRETSTKTLDSHSVLRRYPAEWQDQHTVWLAWPHNEKEWGENRLPKIRKFYEKLISVILNFQDVNLIFPNEESLTEAEAIHELPLEKEHKLKKIIIPNNDVWIRDYGPFFLSGQQIIGFNFNGWGGKYPPWDLDNQVPKEIATYLGEEIESYPMVLEGGAIESSGDGILMTTEECVFNKDRNKDLSKEKIELVLKSAFNIKEIIYLKHGLYGDHTDGHIDNVARFIGPKKVLACRSYNIKDVNFERLLENENKLKEHGLEVIQLPMPEVETCRGKSLQAASYNNFIFVNGGIIVPTFNCKTDELALKIFSVLFPEKEVIGIDCSVLIQEGGGLHCITKQEPKI